MESTKSSVKIGIQNSRIGTVTSFYKWLIFIFSVSHVLSPTSLVKVVEELQSDKFWQNDVCCPNGERKQSKLLLGKLTPNLPRKRNLPTSSLYRKEQQRFWKCEVDKNLEKAREPLCRLEEPAGFPWFCNTLTRCAYPPLQMLMPPPIWQQSLTVESFC